MTTLNKGLLLIGKIVLMLFFMYINHIYATVKCTHHEKNKGLHSATLKSE